MASWGSGLYASDLALDLRDDFRLVCRAPWDADQLLGWAVAAYPMLAYANDDEHAEAQLVLADLLWRYGIEHPATIDAARAVIASGMDLAVKHRLGMADRDLRRRASVLTDLDRRLATPNPRPRPRHILRRPERFVFELGDCFCYPTAGGKLRNPYVTPSAETTFFARHRWAPDGWGAAMVIDRMHEHAVFARYLVALLDGSQMHRPGLADVIESSIIHTEQPPGLAWPMARESRRAIHWISLTPRHRDRMRIELIGRLRLDSEAVARELASNVAVRSLDSSLANVANFGTIGNRVVAAVDPISRYVVDDDAGLTARSGRS